MRALLPTGRADGPASLTLRHFFHDHLPSADDARQHDEAVLTVGPPDGAARSTAIPATDAVR